MKYTIKDLSEGKVSVINDGTLVELKEVLNKAFPKDKVIQWGMANYYIMITSGYWSGFNHTTLPRQSVKDFLVEKFVLPEKWCVQGSKELGLLLTHTNVIGKYTHKYYYNYKVKEKELLKDNQWSYTIHNITAYTEITFEQFEKYVLNNNHNTMKKEYKITYEQAQSIIDIACITWKPKLAVLWGVEIVLQRNDITISKTFYNEMRKACTEEQNELFDTIFGLDEEDSFKAGDWVYIGEETSIWKSVVKLTKDIKDKWGCAIDKIGNESKLNVIYISRKATPEEIEKAQCPYEKGELIFARDDDGDDFWQLRYFSHFEEGRVHTYMSQEKVGDTQSWDLHAPAKGVKLPD